MSGPTTYRRATNHLNREKIKADVAVFLKNGGKIRKIKKAVTAYSEDRIVFMKKTIRNKKNEHDASDT